MALRRALLLALLVLTPALAGCNVKDWYNQRGTVHVELVSLGGANTSLDHFRSITVVLYGVSVKQLGSVDSKEFSFGEQPPTVDLVQMAKSGAPRPLAEFTVSLRAVERVTVYLEVIEAVDAAGNSIQVCRLEDTVEKWPCFFMPSNGSFRYDAKTFSPPRGGSIDVGFPLEVKYAQRGTKSQYYLDNDPNQIRLESHR